MCDEELYTQYLWDSHIYTSKSVFCWLLVRSWRNIYNRSDDVNTFSKAIKSIVVHNWKVIEYRAQIQCTVSFDSTIVLDLSGVSLYLFIRQGWYDAHGLPRWRGGNFLNNIRMFFTLLRKMVKAKNTAPNVFQHYDFKQFQVCSSPRTNFTISRKCVSWNLEN